MEWKQRLLLCSQEPAALFYPVSLDSCSHSPAFFNARLNPTNHKFSLIYNKMFSLCFTLNILPILVAARSKPSVCGRLFAGIAGSNFSGHGCPSAVSVVCCQVEFPATGRSFVQRSPTECVCVCVCVIGRDQLQQ